MALNDRIENLKPYFQSFNVVASDGAAYVLLKFPQKWTIPDAGQIKSNFKCEVAVRNEGLYFVTEIENGVETLFDAADYVIEFNKNVEARMALLNEKIKELREIFATEPLEKIKTLEFVFKIDEKPGKKKGGSKKTAVIPEEVLKENETQTVVDTVDHNAVEISEEGSLLDMAKQLTGE